MAGDRTAHGRDARRGRPPLTVFIDTNVFLYAGGREHPQREVCRRLLDAVQRGEVMATTSVEVVQEIMHVSMRVFGARRAAAVQAARGALQLCAPVLALDLHDASRAIDLVEQIDGLSPRDALHAAVCLRYGLEIVSVDRDFDRVPGLHRRDPTAL